MQTTEAQADYPQLILPGEPVKLEMTDDQRAEVAKLFPDVTVPYQPLNGLVVIQERLPRARSRGGLILAAQTQDQDRIVMSRGRVAAIGPKAFVNEFTDEPEPHQFAVGDYVYLPSYHNTRPKSQSKVQVDGEEMAVAFRLMEAKHLLALITDVRELLS